MLDSREESCLTNTIVSYQYHLVAAMDAGSRKLLLQIGALAVCNAHGRLFSRTCDFALSNGIAVGGVALILPWRIAHRGAALSNISTDKA